MPGWRCGYRIGSGSLFFSHVNDAGFWLVKEVLRPLGRQTLRRGPHGDDHHIAGLAGVMVLREFCNEMLPRRTKAK